MLISLVTELRVLRADGARVVLPAGFVLWIAEGRGDGVRRLTDGVYRYEVDFRELVKALWPENYQVAGVSAGQ